MSVWPAVILFGILLMWGSILSKHLGVPSAEGRFASVDGLRGYLAFGVFVHHGAVWYFFLRTGVWDLPASYLYLNLGQASVLIFFMITGFLFWMKLLRARSEPLDWNRLYFSRVLRLVPLYLLAMMLMAMTVGVIMKFQLRESIFALFRHLLEWSAFSVTGTPDINRLHNTPIIIGKVTWTLPYEWLFYFALPVLAISIRVASPRRFIIASAGLIAWLVYEIRPELIYLTAFGSGIVVAYLVHRNLVQNLSRKGIGSLVAACSLLAALTLFPTAKQILPVALLSIGFALIAGGNTLFGLLTWSVSRFLGQLTYGVYLLHGIVLFWAFRFVIGARDAAEFTPLQHWLVISLCVPAILILCWITFRFVELPAMRSVSSVSTLFRKRSMVRRSGLAPASYVRSVIHVRRLPDYSSIM